MLEGYRINKRNYLPLIDHAWKTFEPRTIVGILISDGTLG